MEVNNLTTVEYKAIEVSPQKMIATLQKIQSPAALQYSVGDDSFASFLGSCARHSRENATESNETKSQYPETNANRSSPAAMQEMVGKKTLQNESKYKYDFTGSHARHGRLENADSNNSKREIQRIARE
jgi:hypothetical protein